jgi:hypothetical protein
LTLAPLEENIDYNRLSSRRSEFSITNFNFDSRALSYDLLADDEVGGQSKQSKKLLIELIFTMIATCHECVPASKGGF